MKSIFNPNNISVSNGNYFALPYSVEESKIVLISVAWDVTSSYKAGSAMAPDSIMDASQQIDLYDIDYGNVYEQGIGTIAFNDEILELSQEVRPSAERVIAFLADGGEQDSTLIAKSIKKVNDACCVVHDYVYKTASEHLSQNKIVALVGGDHSTPYGLIKALADKYESFGILHIDAHADLRDAYEGFTHSHASIMHNVMKDIHQVSNLVQVGIRDFCEDEFNVINSNPKIDVFFDARLAERQLEGDRWCSIVDEIVARLPQNVYISFDIDGLESSYCPNTGTPVPGGLTYSQAIYILNRVVADGKTIIGFDLNEVGHSEHSEWDSNVGARLIYKMACATLFSNYDSDLEK